MADQVLVMAGDIGGTKTRLGLFEVGEELRAVSDRSYRSKNFSGLEEVVAEFLGDGDTRCQAACIGVAGPVLGRTATTTNLPWVVDADAVERRMGIPAVVLINDLEATAWGIPLVKRRHVLNPGERDKGGNGAVIAPGTGLGQAGLYWDGERHLPFACEGGHSGFSPRDETGDGLLRFLRRKHGHHVSWERVLSGPGLADIYRFLLEDRGQQQPDWLLEATANGDPAAAVSDRGLRDEGSLCAEALGLFVLMLGDEAANLALKLMATGGVWIGGGIAPRILPVLSSGGFMAAFTAKGRMRPLLESMPVEIILDDTAALVGAAHRAAVALNWSF